MTGTYNLDEQGAPVEVDVTQWRPADPSWRVAEDIVGPYWVSTMFLGLDHSFSGGPPILWETMIFRHGMENSADGTTMNVDYGGIDNREYQWRYTSREVAIECHTRIVAYLREGKPIEGLLFMDIATGKELLGDRKGVIE